MSDPILDELYWHSDLGTAEIAARCGLADLRLHTRVTPLDAGVTCFRCSSPLAYTSRSQRQGPGRLRCGTCGCTRRNPGHVPRSGSRHGTVRPTVVGGVVLVVDVGGDLGHGVEAGVDALAAAGVTWGGELAIADGNGPDAATCVLAAVEPVAPDVLGIHSLADLGSSQTECLQVLFALTRRGWRVASLVDVVPQRHQPLSAWDLDQLDDDSCGPYDVGLVLSLVEATTGWRSGRVRSGWP